MDEVQIKDYLLQVKQDSADKVRGYIANEPKELDEASDMGHAVGQLELAESMLDMFFNED